MSEIIDISAFNKVVKSDVDFKVVLLYGEEEYLINNAVNVLKRKYLTSESEQMDCCVLDYDNKSVAANEFLTDVESNIMIPAWMSRKRMVIVRNIDIFAFNSNDKEFFERAGDIFEKIPKEAVLIFTADKIDKRKKSILNLFLVNGYAVEANLLDDDKLAAYIRRQLSSQNVTIDEAAVNSLISRCDKKLRAVATEINKLLLYCEGKGISAIDGNLIETMCPPDIRGSVFDITDAIGSGNPAKALLILNTLISNLMITKEPPTKIRAMFNKQIKQLICAKELGNEKEIISRMKVHPFVAKKLNAQARSFTMETLLELYSKCGKMDADIKHGLIEERQALEMLIVLSSAVK
ncbi:MAG: DNA polymerase III subunit delta [Clostridia bacterium]|nr:DNA polymerase III subunit delta [Clostridia bacterium]